MALCPCGHLLSRPEATSNWREPSHLDEHIVPVTMAGGWPGRSYVCPTCGQGDRAWGNPGEAEASLIIMSRALFKKHLEDAHGITF